MRKRQKLRSKSAQKMFSSTAKRVHPKNTRSAPMRGGIRL